MRVDVSKFLFLGPASYQKQFFTQAQEYGVVEFIDTIGKKSPEPTFLSTLTKAYKVLLAYPEDTPQPLGDQDNLDIAQRVLDLRDQIEVDREAIRLVNMEESRIRPFGYFDLVELKEIAKASNKEIQFFFSNMPSEKLELEDKPQLIAVSQSNSYHYFISIANTKQKYEGFHEIKIGKDLTNLALEKKNLQKEILTNEQKIHQIAHYRSAFKDSIIEKLDKNNLFQAQKNIDYFLHENIFAVEGWVAQHKLEELGQLMKQTQVVCEKIKIDKEDKIPTCLYNKGVARIGEDLVHIYDTPSSEDKDPSIWVLGFFSLFFAMIISDGGYGLLFLLGSLFLNRKFRAVKGLGKRVLHLAIIVSTACIIWGTLTHSFFGMNIGVDSALKKFSILQWACEQKASYLLETKTQAYQEIIQSHPESIGVKTPVDFLTSAKVTNDHNEVNYPILNEFYDKFLLEFAIFIGILHIIISLLRNIKENYSGIGWIAFLIGAYLYFPVFLQATSFLYYIGGVDPVLGGALGIKLVWMGFSLAILLAVIKNKLGGLAEIANVIQISSDVLSYLRLYALGLAGGMMSSTFNSIGNSVPIYVGFLIIIVGHLVNIVLSIMGGVIHGLRLNFLEWYHYCFDGGGKMLRPLKLLQKTIN